MKNTDFPWDGYDASEIDRARLVLKKFSTHVIEEMDERNEKLFALAVSIENELRPSDPDHPPCGHPSTAWRLSQILTELLGNTASINVAHQCLLGEK